MGFRALAMACLLTGVVFSAPGKPAAAGTGLPAPPAPVSAGNDGARALQHRVDRYLGRLGGVQTAPDTIDVDGRATLRVTVPGRAAASCPAYAFCAYAHENYAGDVLELRSCDYFYLPFAGFGSYRNNRLPGTPALFYDHERRFCRAGLAGVPKLSWTYIDWIKPCA